MLAFRYHRAGTDQAVIADDGIVEHCRTDAHQHVVADRAAMKHRMVANRAAVPDCEGRTRIGVQHRALLDVGARSHHDWRVVGAYDGAEPDTHSCAQSRIANDIGGWRNPHRAVLRQCWAIAVNLIERHLNLSRFSPEV